jgi:peroxiredoxin Q/BCP
MTIQVGDQVPVFTAKKQDGGTFDLQDYLGKPLVIYFYPKDFTPGCTTQACSFRDFYQDFQDLGAEVIGISSDTTASHEAFQEKYKLPFILLSDYDRKIRKAFGVPTSLFGLLPGRVTYVIHPDGTVKMVFNSMSAKNHITKALEMVREFQK